MFCVELRLSREVTPSNHAFESHPSRQPCNEADNSAEKDTGNAVTPPQQRAQYGADHEARTAKDQHDRDLAERIVQDADVRHRPLAFLPPTPMPRRTARGTWRRTELGAGLAGGGGGGDLAAGADVVGRRVARGRAGGAEGRRVPARRVFSLWVVD